MPLVQTRGAASAQGFGEFAQAAVIPQYIEDLFSTYLYAGNSSTQTITNNLDLSNEGGLVWIRQRSAGDNVLMDTVRGANYYLSSNSTAASAFNAVPLTPFTSTGFDINVPYGNWNASGTNYCSWSFREQPKFFDIVTYTGTGSNTTIAHNLGSVPGSIWVKRTDTTSDWQVYHRSLANTQYLVLNSTAAAATGATRWNSTTPTSLVFSVGTDATVNASSGTYLAYIFAHDAGGFGDLATDNAITCGLYTTNGSGNATVTLGYEPQWLMWKGANVSEQWNIQDTMRGFTNNLATDKRLFADLSIAEQTGDYFHPTATGFTSTSGLGQNNSNYIYIAIRRGAMKVPTVGTSVFALGGTASSTLTTSFPVDAFIQNSLTSNAANSRFCSRLQGSNIRLITSGGAAETADNGDSQFNGNSYTVVGAGSGIVFGFQRAPSFFDEVCYKGDDVSGRTVTHNLAAVPELMIVRSRTSNRDWIVYSVPNGATNAMNLNNNLATASSSDWASTAPTSTVFSVGNSSAVNDSTTNYVAYLFATCAGVSKVGSYTGTGTTQTINCGFTAGSRFVLIKRTDATGDWYVWDSARGIVAGNDPYILLNSTAAQVTGTDYIDTAATGFEISSTAPAAINASAGTFIFLAIA